MDILITGGTGLIGHLLCQRLTQAGHRITVLSRTPAKVAERCGPGVEALSGLHACHPERYFDAIINLAGAPIVDRPWTQARKAQLLASRVTLTEELVAAIARAQRKPQVLLSGSAIGYYGDMGEAACSDLHAATPPGSDFGAQLCASWETAARKAEDLGVRVCLLRTGLVLAQEGGFLAKLLPAFKLGLGTRLGKGQQWMSWIHMEDYLNALLRLLQDGQASGPHNLSAPHPVRNTEFTRALGQALHRPTPFVAPRCLIQLALGQRAYFLLGGQKVLPDRLSQSGFEFRYPQLGAALEALL